MRLLSFDTAAERQPRLGVLSDADSLIDLTAVGSRAPFDQRSMLSLIESGDEGLRWVEAQLKRRTSLVRLSGLHLLPPIPQLRKNVFCVGWNYLEHFKEGEKTREAPVEVPEHPVFFSKATTTLNGPYDPIPIGRETTGKLDWEIELGVIIGRRGRDIAAADAMNHVWGYTVINDVTGRDLQRRHGQWFKGKSLDGSCPMGPFISTADSIDPAALNIACRVNGVTKQTSNTRFMHFKLDRLICDLSHGMTLEPGDIIATGTPSGVGHARNPPEFLQAGDLLESEIEHLGLLRNVVAG